MSRSRTFRTPADPDEHLPLRPVELLLLAALQDEPRYGYALVTRIGELTGGRIEPRPGDLYRVLHRLERRDLLARAGREPVGDEASGERRTYYRLTPLGRRVLEVELRMLRRVAAVVLGPEEPEPA